MFKKQSGRSMIEMLGVLAIVGILSAGGIAGYSMAMQTHKTNALIEKIQLIAQQTRTLYNGDYTTMNSDGEAQALIRAGLIKDVESPFGGNMRVRAGNSNKMFFVIEVPQVGSVETCVKILMHGFGSPSVFKGVSVGRAGVGYTDLFYYNNTYPVSVSEATTICEDSTLRIHLNFY